MSLGFIPVAGYAERRAAAGMSLGFILAAGYAERPPPHSSFPRKRESRGTRTEIAALRPVAWIPAFAGMTNCF